MSAYVPGDERSTTPTWVRTTVVANEDEMPKGRQAGDVLHILYSEHTWSHAFDAGPLPVNRMVARADGVVLFIERLALRSEIDIGRFAEALGHAWRDAIQLRQERDLVCAAEGNTNMSVILDHGGVTLVIGYLRLMVPEAIATLITALERARYAAGGLTTLGAGGLTTLGEGGLPLSA